MGIMRSPIPLKIRRQSIKERSMKKEKIASMVIWFAILLAISSTASMGAQGQPSMEGFISIDCGLADNQGYVDGATGIPYTSDEQFIGTGKKYNISAKYMSPQLPAQYWNLRSFPDGARNCYTLKPVVRERKYLVRASFLYGDYDDVSRPTVRFDLHLGANLWRTINISDPSSTVVTEVFAVAAADFLSVCLVNTGGGVPFVSALELRPLKGSIYPCCNATQPIVLHTRNDAGGNGTVRYPGDPYDRVWQPFAWWQTVSTQLPISYGNGDLFEAPSAVLQTASTRVNFDAMFFRWAADTGKAERFYLILYFTEVILLPANGMRMFDIHSNFQLVMGLFQPPYLVSDYVYIPVPFTGSTDNRFYVVATDNSTLPPICNAFEIYYAMQLTEMDTDANDVEAMMAIKSQYQLKRNWQGDPCAPKEYAWDGLNCTDRSDSPPHVKVIRINLSSSGLAGEISVSFALLSAIEYLDLSYNYLTGEVPDFLGNMLSLKVLNLTGNKFTGSIPSSLLERSQEGSLILRFTNNSILHNNTVLPEVDNRRKTKIKRPVIVVVSLVPTVLLLFLALSFLWMKTMRQIVIASSVTPHAEENMVQISEHQNHTLPFSSLKLSYIYLERITNNFTKVIGQGASGTVYLGYLENSTPVAVKVHSPATSQPTEKFVSEAKILTRIHHRNLVSLLGYCKDGNHVALVYEYMPKGTLKDHLQERGNSSRTLSWRDRLRIALEAAHGLEYLHRWCMPPIIHRDVKTSNILLGDKLEAKLTDYGLSKSFSNSVDVTFVDVPGTPGYTDPEFHFTYQLTRKSDIYSFGVVLLELVTGQRVIHPGRRKIHIVQLMAPYLARGNIDPLIDPRLQGSYNHNSLWKVTDLAMKCTADVSSLRPTIDDVVLQLKECMELETAPQIDTEQSGEGANSGQFATSEVHVRESIPSTSNQA